MRQAASVPFTLDLPMPPSTNSIWRYGRRGRPSKPYLSKEYVGWKAECDGLLMATQPRPKKVTGPFVASVVLSQEERRGNEDADNRTKACLDWLQRVELIDNDSKAERVTVSWGEAPAGCRVTVIPVIPVVKVVAP